MERTEGFADGLAARVMGMERFSIDRGDVPPRSRGLFGAKAHGSAVGRGSMLGKAALPTIAGIVFALCIAVSDVHVAAQTPTSAPTTAPASGAWAFHGGGPLLGQAPPLAAAPMKLRWTYQSSDDGDAGIEGAAAIDRSAVYVADAKGILHSIDLATGRRRWSYQGSAEGFATTPLVASGRVLIGDLSGMLHAVAVEDGRKFWSVNTEAPIHASVNAAGSEASRVVVANDDGKIFCIDPTDGRIVWSAQAGDRVNSACAIANDMVYVAGCDAILLALNLSDGRERFHAEMGALSAGSASVAGDRIVIGTDLGRVVCLSSGKGERLWSYEKVDGSAMVYASAAVADGVVVAGARDRQVHGIDLGNGESLWTFKTRLDVDSSPVISDGRVYVGSKDKSLYVLDLKSGRQVWDFKTSRGIVAGPVIDEGVLVVGDMAGNVYCLEPVAR